MVPSSYTVQLYGNVLALARCAANGNALAHVRSGPAQDVKAGAQTHGRHCDSTLLSRYLAYQLGVLPVYAVPPDACRPSHNRLSESVQRLHNGVPCREDPLCLSTSVIAVIANR